MYLHNKNKKDETEVVEKYCTKFMSKIDTLNLSPSDSKIFFATLKGYI